MKKYVICVTVVLLSLLLTACGFTLTPGADTTMDRSTVETSSRTSSRISDSTPEPVLETEPEYILTIEYIRTGILSGGSMITGWHVIDESGDELQMPVDLSEWFTNAQLICAPSPIGSLALTNMFRGDFVGGIITEGSILKCVMSINGIEYDINVSPGAQLVVNRDSDGNFILLPEETTALSPIPEAPSEPQQEPEPIDEWFGGISWSDAKVHFTANQNARISGISVFVGDEEWRGDIISNTSGDMGLPNGATAWAGSRLSLSRNNVIVHKGTVAYCEIDTGGATPNRVVFYLASGEELEKAL